MRKHIWKLAEVDAERYQFNSELNTLFSLDNSYRYTDESTATEIDRFWDLHGGLRYYATGPFPTGKERIPIDKTPILLWQSYHFLLAYHEPLVPREVNRRERQFTALEELLRSRHNAVISIPGLPRTLVGANEITMHNDLADLRRNYGSPFYPVSYYPLEDDKFAELVKKLTQIQDDNVAALRVKIESLSQPDRREEWWSLIGKADRPANQNAMTNALQDAMRKTSLEFNRAHLIARLQVDPHDQKMFPLKNCQGLSLPDGSAESWSDVRLTGDGFIRVIQRVQP